MEIKITIEELEILLIRQKELVIEKLSDHTGYYNSDSTPGDYKMINLDKVKFKEQGMKSRFPEDFNILKKYAR